MPKLDLKKQLKHLYQPSVRKVVLVDVPRMSFLMIDGRGDPNTSQGFQEAVDALYGVSYRVKFGLKQQGIGPEYTVMPLEGLWWMADGREFDMNAKDDWDWTLMIMQPDHIRKGIVELATAQLQEKKDPPALSRMRFESFEERLCAQIMHMGPYAEEGPTIRKIHDFAQQEGYRLRDKHHEIYLGDPRRTKPERLKTVLRQPVEKV